MCRMCSAPLNLSDMKWRVRYYFELLTCRACILDLMADAGTVVSKTHPACKARAIWYESANRIQDTRAMPQSEKNILLSMSVFTTFLWEKYKVCSPLVVEGPFLLSLFDVLTRYL